MYVIYVREERSHRKLNIVFATTKKRKYPSPIIEKDDNWRWKYRFKFPIVSIEREAIVSSIATQTNPISNLHRYTYIRMRGNNYETDASLLRIFIYATRIQSKFPSPEWLRNFRDGLSTISLSLLAYKTRRKFDRNSLFGGRK